MLRKVAQKWKNLKKQLCKTDEIIFDDIQIKHTINYFLPSVISQIVLYYIKHEQQLYLLRFKKEESQYIFYLDYYYQGDVQNYVDQIQIPKMYFHEYKLKTIPHDNRIYLFHENMHNKTAWIGYIHIFYNNKLHTILDYIFASCPRVKSSYCIFNGLLYSIGGIQYTYDDYTKNFNSPHNTSDVFILEQDSWIYKNKMNFTRVGCASVVYNKKLYVIGGSCSSIAGSSIEYYEPKIGWTLCDEIMRIPRENHAVIVFDNKLFVIGGTTWEKNSYIPTKIVEIFDFHTKKWDFISCLNRSYFDINVVILNNQIICMGKIKSKIYVEIYNYKLNKWFDSNELTNIMICTKLPFVWKQPM
jgi:hypothetical protein